VDPLWPADGQALCVAAGQQRLPRIATDGSGGAIVAWQDSRGVGFDICAQHALASGAVNPAWPADGAVLCQAINDQNSPFLVGDGAGGAIVTRYDSRGTGVDIYASRVYTSGGVADVPALGTAALPPARMGALRRRFAHCNPEAAN
jgi:hypothetical protein